MWTAAPAVPKWTLVPDRCRSCSGRAPCSVMSRAALASMSSTSARGKRMRPSSPWIAPASVSSSTPEGGACDEPDLLQRVERGLVDLPDARRR